MHLAARLCLAASLLLAACGDPAEPLHDSLDGHVEFSQMPTTCAAHLEHYPIQGPHNGGYDSNALNYTCPDHPSSAPDNSDFIGGDHYGNDLFAANGTPVVAVVSGTVFRSGWASVSGNRVTIEDSCGWHYFAAHLDAIAPGVTQGSNVTAGQLIGWVGNTGNAASTSPHVHFSIYPETYNAGIDPFPFLEGVDADACNGDAGWAGGDDDDDDGPSGPGDEPDAGWNPCVDGAITSNVAEASFALVSGATSALTEIGGSSGEFLVAPPYSNVVELAVGKWAPWISHTGKWSVEAFVPETSRELATSAVFDIAFHGGHALELVDLNAAKGSWVPLFSQPLKFVAGPTSYISLTNLSPADGGWLAYDSVRWVFEGPTGSAGQGGSCDLSDDCSGNLICGEFGTCEQPCTAAGCDVGVCDPTTAVCIEPDEIDSEEPFDMAWADFDGDGIPNYLDGFDDADGDGFPNYLDVDSDNDGIPDAVEGSTDMDNDGVLDHVDLDADGDGIPDEDEVGDYPDMPLDSDLDGIPDFQDTDSDNDGIPDEIEVGHPDEPLDTDNDGIPNHLDDDSDGDGIPDGEEAGWEPTDPADDNNNGTPDYLEPGEGAVSDGGLDLDLPDAQDFGDGCGCSSGGSASGWWALLLLPLIRRRR